MDFKQLFLCPKEATDEEISALVNGVSLEVIESISRDPREEYIDVELHSEEYDDFVCITIFFNGNIIVSDREISTDVARFMENLWELNKKKGLL